MDRKGKPAGRTGLEIAVIGMAGRFPGAGNIYEYWDNLKNGVESIAFFSDRELEASGVEKQSLENPAYVKAHGCLQDKEIFDASFFGYSPREAELMNPQIRILHECVWEALEDAGYNPGSYDDRIGLYAGASPSFYWQVLAYVSGESSLLGGFASSHFIDRDYLCARVSYNLNLKGACSFVQTACSTSLVAINQACRALLTGESEIVLAGGCAISSSPRSGYVYREGMILSSDGHCRTFDTKSDGTIGGEGVGVVVLKRLKPAVEDRDFIYAVIRGSALNNDGSRKVGFTAPSVEAQAEVIRTAQRMARVQPETVTYIEAHGTGTGLGDPVEVEALKLAFNTQKRNYCGIGSVKSNFGHLDAAAGAAGFIKTVLALRHKLIPPGLHFNTPNAKINLEDSPFYVNTTLKTWEGNGYPLRAGVSSFGIGGTNAHVVLEEWPEVRRADVQKSDGQKPRLIVFSAKTGTALEKMNRNLAGHFSENPGINLADAAYTLQVGRKAFPHRRMMICTDVEEAAEMLSTPGSPQIRTFTLESEKDKRLIFMFPGQGAQYVNMGLDLYRTEPVFREEMDRCFEILTPMLGVPIKEILYPDSAPQRTQSAQRKEFYNKTSASSAVSAVKIKLPGIDQTEIAQPVLFVVEYALAKLLMARGIVPKIMIGHSIGEYTAACLSGVFSLEDALNLVVLRGKLMQQMPPGSMLGVPLGEGELLPLLKGHEEVSLAAVNSVSRCTVSGPFKAVDAFAEELNAAGCETTRLHTSHAFHSGMMEPILETFAAHVRRLTLNPPQIPFIANVTGKGITAEQAVDPAYWAGHIRNTVRFSSGVAEILRGSPPVFVEVGPGNALSTLVKQHKTGENNSSPLTVNTIRHPKEKISDDGYLLSKIGRMWLYGLNMEWEKFYPAEKPYRLPLPTYPFEGKRYWFDTDALKTGMEKMAGKSFSVKKSDMADWFYIPSWEQGIARRAGFPERLNWLVFMNETEFAAGLVEHLLKNGQQVVQVKAGAQFTPGMAGDGSYTVNPRRPEDYEALLAELRRLNKAPQKIIHLWWVTGNDSGRPGLENLDEFLDLGFFSLLNIVQAAGKLYITDQIRIEVLTDNMQKVTGEEPLCPEKAVVLGAVKIIPLEYANIKCRSIDIPVLEPGSRRESQLYNLLLGEFTSDAGDNVVAYRGTQRWKRVYRPFPVEKTGETEVRFRQGGVYLVIGGLGGMGFTVAQHLAGTYAARLALVGRSAFPGREEWESRLTGQNSSDEIAEKIRKIREWEETGAEVMVLRADAADPEQMKGVLSQVNDRFGPLNGIIFAAGVIDFAGAIQKRSREATMKYMAAKINGVLVLEKLLRDTKLDFLVLFSSLGNVIYEQKFGQVSYNASNEFLEAFADWKSLEGNDNGFTAVINWSDWKEVGMTVKALTRRYAGQNQALDFEKILYDGLSPSQGVEVFERVMGGSLHRVCVSTTDLEVKLREQEKKLEETGEESSGEEIKVNGSARDNWEQRPELSTPYAAPATPTEKILVDIFQQLTGIEPVGIHDDFFELGGDSLKAMAAITHIHKLIHIQVPLAVFFSTSTIEGIARYIDSASTDQCSSIEPAETKEYYPVSSSQKRMYILQQMDLNSTAYNQPSLFEFLGFPGREKLEHVFIELIRRHEVLRTSIEVIDEEPVQLIHDEIAFGLEGVEIAGEEDLEKVFGAFIRPFDMSRSPLLRVGVVNIGDSKYSLMVDTHHIVMDVVSKMMLMRDFSTILYEMDVPPLKLQYKDFCQWQTGEEQQRALAGQEKYWLKKFAGDIPVLELPYDYPRPAVQSFEGDRIRFELEDETAAQLKTLAAEQGVTLYIFLLTLFNVLLYRLTGHNDFIVGSDIAGRSHPDLQHVVGMFVSTLALRFYCSGDRNFETFLQEIKETTLEAFENQDYPFEKLVEQVVKDRDLSRNPLFDAAFFLNSLNSNPAGGGDSDTVDSADRPAAGEAPILVPLPLKKEGGSSMFDLALLVREAGDKLFFTFEYCTKLFKREKIEAFAILFRDILGAVLESSNISLNEIKLSHHLLAINAGEPEIQLEELDF